MPPAQPLCCAGQEQARSPENEELPGQLLLRGWKTQETLLPPSLI